MYKILYLPNKPEATPAFVNQVKLIIPLNIDQVLGSYLKRLFCNQD